MDPNLSQQCVKNLVFIGRAMHLNPELCFAEDAAEVDEGTDDGDYNSNTDERGENTTASEIDDDGDSEKEKGGVEDSLAEGDNDDDSAATATTGNSSSSKKASAAAADPLRWVFSRMSHMVVHKGEARRRAVFSWFLAMVAVHEPAVSVDHLKLMLLPLRRAVLDAESGGVEHKVRGSSAGDGGGAVAGAGRAAGAEKEQTSAELATEVGWSIMGKSLE